MMSPFRKQKKYIQKYRTKWEYMDEFKGWLKPLPKDTTKAYCSVCNVVIKAHLCDLRKHGSAKKHANATELVNTLKNLRDEQTEDMDSDLNPLRDSNQDIAEEGSDEEENASDEEGSGRWPPEAIDSLIKHTKVYWKDLQDGLRKKKDIWEDICMAMVSEGHIVTSSECNKKFRNMKLRYFYVLERTLLGDSSNIRIEYFDDLDEMLSNDPETISYLERKKESLKSQIGDGDLSEEGTIVMEEPCIDNFVDGECTIMLANYDSVWSDAAVHLLLDYLKEFKDYFTGKEGENEDEVWQNLREQMHQHGYMFDENQCRKKWHSMVKKFNECKFVVDTTGVLPIWPYFTRVRHILKIVKIPTQNAVSDSTDRRFFSISAKRGRKRGRKRKVFDETTGAEDSDASVGESSSPFKRKFAHFGDDDDNNNNSNNNNNNNRNSHRGKETLRMMRHLTETASLWRRMDSIETRLDDLSDHHEIQSQTNSLLSQILNEVSVLANNLLPATHDPVSVQQEGITIVVPNSEQSMH
ncbi:UNVERIFIED_CONTAM: hypothetical protein RMT77_006581 [Armadillidium vulgare]